MGDLQFALVREGPSDDGLVDVIRILLTRAGASAAFGAARTYKGTTREKLEKVLAEGGVLDLIFVHRDPDARDSTARYGEIVGAANELDCTAKVVAVVPVRETEAWLLTDESAIRTVVSGPSGRVPLNLPRARRIEETAHPKEVLRGALKAASESNGARLKKVSGQFSRHRATLLERLDIDGSVNELASWGRFVDDLTAAAQRILTDTPDVS